MEGDSLVGTAWVRADLQAVGRGVIEVRRAVLVRF